VYVFQVAADGWRYTPAPAAGGHPLGVNPAYDVPNYVTMAAPLDDPPLDVLYHAYAHQFLDDNFPRLPLTVTEGLAEFYCRFTTAPEGTLIGISNPDHVRWLREHPLPSLSGQFSLGAGSRLLVEAPGRSTFMAGSWAMMHYLVSGSGQRRSRLPMFLEALQRGVSPDDAAIAAFATTLDHLQQEVAEYVAGDRHLPIRIGLEAQDAREDRSAPVPKSVEMRRMERDEVLAALGEVLAHAETRRAADAEAHLDAALHVNPTQSQAYAGLGYLRYTQGRFAEAIPHLEKAIGIEPDAMSCYLLAKSLFKVHASAPIAPPGAAAPAGTPTPPGEGSATPPWLKRAQDLLARAIAIRPRFAAPYVLLGASHIEPDGDVSAGIDLLQKAHAMLPARMDIVGNLVYLLLRNGDWIRAQALVDGVLARSGDVATLQTAQRAIATFREHLEARQSLYRTRETPAEKARREALARTTDPAAKARIAAQLEQLEMPPSKISFNDAVVIFNDAVDRANQRDYAKAIALLEDLLPRVEAKELREKIDALLVRFRQDAARLLKPIE
jgi:tetratricopeptide (TPR) repeat protein